MYIMEKDKYILSFDQIKEFSDFGFTVGELKKRVDEYNELNNIRCYQKLADENLYKCLREQTE